MQEVTFGDNKKEKREGGNRGVWRSGVNFPCFLRVNLSGREISALATDDDDDDAVGIIVLEGEGKTTAATACSNSFRSLMFLFPPLPAATSAACNRPCLLLPGGGHFSERVCKGGKRERKSRDFHFGGKGERHDSRAKEGEGEIARVRRQSGGNEVTPPTPTPPPTPLCFLIPFPFPPFLEGVEGSKKVRGRGLGANGGH